MNPNWPKETPAIWKMAHGSLALFCALVALRKTESGPPGNDFGVLSIASADTFAEELDVAARSIRNHVERCRAKGVRIVDPVTGLYATEFLEDFSHRWAPLGAENDPRNLNAAHARNLVRLYDQVATQLAKKAAEIRL